MDVHKCRYVQRSPPRIPNTLRVCIENETKIFADYSYSSCTMCYVFHGVASQILYILHIHPYYDFIYNADSRLGIPTMVIFDAGGINGAMPWRPIFRKFLCIFECCTLFMRWLSVFVSIKISSEKSGSVFRTRVDDNGQHYFKQTVMLLSACMCGVSYIKQHLYIEI
jgi:hypothetical protein